AEHGKGGRKSAVGEAAAKRKRRGQRKGGSQRRKARPFQLVGRIPTGEYPTVAAATKKRRQLVWVSARSLGVRPNPNGPTPTPPANNDNQINTYQYLPSIVSG